MHQLRLEKSPEFLYNTVFIDGFFEKKLVYLSQEAMYIVDICYTCEELRNKIKSNSLNDVAEKNDNTAKKSEKVFHESGPNLRFICRTK